MRIGGLASGMDIDSLVEKLMTAEKAPLNKLYQRKQTYEWQRDAYRDVNKQLQAFDKYIADNLRLESVMLKKNAASSNEAVKVTANADAAGSLKIDNITQLAKNTTVLNDTSKGITGNQKLSELGITDKQDIKMQVLQKDGTLKEVKFTFNPEDTVKSVINKLNKSDSGLNAFFDEKSGGISLSTVATGKGVEYKKDGATVATETAMYVEEGMAIFTALGFGSNQQLDDASNQIASKGQNAKLTVNGLEIERTSNNFNISGYNISLQKVYNTTTQPADSPIEITSTTDVDNMFDKIKEFVTTYNGLVDSLNSLTKQKKYRDFPPLTEEQKADMDEKEIEKWEEKAKSGVLRNDQIVQGALNKMRSILYEKGGSSNALMDTLHELGITTTKTYTDGGKLEIDETKLKQKIAEDPRAIFETFWKDTEGSKGIANKLRASIDETKVKIEERAGKASSTDQTYTIGKNLVDVDKRIDTWKLKLEAIERRYWNQFTAMEKAINKANEQSSLFMTGQK